MSWQRIFYIVLVVIIAAGSALSGAVAGGLIVYQTVQERIQTANPPAVMQTRPAPVSESTQKIQISTTEFETTITKAVEKVGPAVVTVIGVIPGQPTFFGFSGDQQVSGSGVFISSDGYVLTNNHVVEGTGNVELILADGSQIPAKIIGTDLYADLAVLKGEVKAPVAAASFIAADLGNSDVLKPGETVIAIGSPLGDFKNTVTVGVVSATGRNLDTGRGYSIEGLIQTDAAINQGNSGGPLINLAGQVVGINTLVVRGSGMGGTQAEGLGFAIPSNTARAFAEQVIQKGYFARPSLGIRWQPITPNIAAAYNLPVEWGVYVSSVIPGSPAAKTGLQQGDIIVKIGDTTLDEDHSFINALFNYQPGMTVALQIVRNGAHLDLQVTLGEAKSP